MVSRERGRTGGEDKLREILEQPSRYSPSDSEAGEARSALRLPSEFNETEWVWTGPNRFIMLRPGYSYSEIWTRELGYWSMVYVEKP